MARVRGFSLKRPQGLCNHTWRRNGHSAIQCVPVDRLFSTKTAQGAADQGQIARWEPNVRPYRQLRSCRPHALRPEPSAKNAICGNC